MQIEPVTAQSSDAIRVGQRFLSQTVAMTRQHTAPTAATRRPHKPEGPTGLAVNSNGTAPTTTIIAATTRQVVVCDPRAARNAVSE